jgi:ATP/ADP translocase
VQETSKKIANRWNNKMTQFENTYLGMILYLITAAFVCIFLVFSWHRIIRHGYPWKRFVVPTLLSICSVAFASTAVINISINKAYNLFNFITLVWSNALLWLVLGIYMPHYVLLFRKKGRPGLTGIPKQILFFGSLLTAVSLFLMGVLALTI